MCQRRIAYRFKSCPPYNLGHVYDSCNYSE